MTEPSTSIFKGRLGEVAKKTQEAENTPVLENKTETTPNVVELSISKHPKPKTGLKGRPRKKEEEKALRIGISLYPETLASLDAIQERENLPRSALIERWVKRGIEEYLRTGRL